MATPPVLPAILIAFFYGVPAVILHLVSGSLADPRREAWEPPPEAERWKRRYRRGAFLAQYLNLFLLGGFLVKLLAVVVLADAACDARADHLRGAAWNLTLVADRVFAVGFVLLALFAVAAFVWSVGYFRAARRAGWADPRRRDGLIVHGGLVPLALLLLLVAFGALTRALCPGLA